MYIWYSFFLLKTSRESYMIESGDEDNSRNKWTYRNVACLLYTVAKQIESRDKERLTAKIMECCHLTQQLLEFHQSLDHLHLQKQ